MIKKINPNKLIDFSQGKYSYKDYLMIKSWFKNAGKDKELERQLFEQWNEIVRKNDEDDSNLHHIFEKVQQAISSVEKKLVIRKTAWMVYRSAAAILLIPVLIFSIWILSIKRESIPSNVMAKSWIEINAPEAASVEFLLPDSTKGWLNGGSKLKYASDFMENRNVELKGEAYFEVKHLEKSDFIVGLNKLNIKVLGTKFNVSDYASDFFTDIVLLEGKINVSDKTGVFNQELFPDQKISYDIKNQSAKLSQVDATRFAEWKDGFLIIDNEPLGQVLNRIERWYNAEIVVEDEALKSYRFKATFKDEPLEEVLRLISLTTPIEYHIAKRDVDGVGVLKRKKVIIKHKK